MDSEDQSNLVQVTAVRKVTNVFRASAPSPIPLDLPRWISLRASHPTANDVDQVRKVLQYFLDVATDNLLNDTVAAHKLKQALKLVDSIQPQTDIASIPIISRTSYAEARLPLIQIENQILSSNDFWRYGASLSRAAVYEVPIFNIWDSISLIYTLCVEDIHTDLRAELHLFQFRTIIRILSTHWYRKSYSPSTVAAAWSVSPSNGTKCIAFATTCSGRGLNKRKNAEARFTFAKSLIHGLQKLETIEGILEAYSAGNCPEYPSVVLVCRLPGDYLSLCLNLDKNRIYKMCDYCGLLVRALAEMSINVRDFWLTAQLGTGRGVEIRKEEGFSFRELLSYEHIKRIV